MWGEKSNFYTNASHYVHYDTPQKRCVKEKARGTVMPMVTGQICSIAHPLQLELDFKPAESLPGLRCACQNTSRFPEEFSILGAELV